MRRLLSATLEGARVARAQLVVSALIGLISIAVVVTSVEAAANSIDAQSAVQRDLEASGARTILIRDDTGDGSIVTAAVNRIAGMSNVEWAVGFGKVGDVTAFAGGTPVAASTFYGHSPDLIVTAPAVQAGLLVSRLSSTQLGLALPLGQVNNQDGAPEPVIGSFVATGVLSDISTRALRLDSTWTGPVTFIALQARRGVNVGLVAEEARSLLGAVPGSAIRLDVPTALNDARERLDTTLVGSGRAAVAIALIAGLMFISATIFAGVLGRRRDYGRRRALGASRGQLVVVVAAQTLTPAIPSSLAGCLVAASTIGSSLAKVEFIAATGTLTVLVALVASLVPAAFVARLDPLKSLRVA
jgi:putative ABC transport system permease protein